MANAAFSYRSRNKSSDSDSDDSDNDHRDWKKASERDTIERMEEIPVDPPQPPPMAPQGNQRVVKRRRNNIWCEVLEDQMMSETLNICGIKNKPKNFGSRGAESYDYTLGHQFKRKHESDDEMSDDTSKDKDSVPLKEGSRRDKFFVPLNEEELKVAKKIVYTLGEKKHHLIFRVVKNVGIEKACQLLEDTKEIEDKGGMMINNQKRRRTPGGVYLQLLKADKDITKETIDKIFEGEWNSYEHKNNIASHKKRKQAKKLRKLEIEKQRLLSELEGQDSNEKQPEQEKNGDECETMEQEVELQETTLDSCPSKSLDLEDGEI